MADAMVEYRGAGYTYLAIDDCWSANHRDEHGHMVPDPGRFPHGMAALADYVSNTSNAPWRIT
jgi:alpha-galactosidase